MWSARRERVVERPAVLHRGPEAGLLVELDDRPGRELDRLAAVRVDPVDLARDRGELVAEGRLVVVVGVGVDVVGRVDREEGEADGGRRVDVLRSSSGDRHRRRCGRSSRPLACPPRASSITWPGVRPVRAISRIDCCGKIGSIPAPARRIASTCPGVARPIRSPKPKLGLRPRVEQAARGRVVGLLRHQSLRRRRFASIDLDDRLDHARSRAWCTTGRRRASSSNAARCVIQGLVSIRPSSIRPMIRVKSAGQGIPRAEERPLGLVEDRVPELHLVGRDPDEDQPAARARCRPKAFDIDDVRAGGVDHDVGQVAVGQRRGGPSRRVSESLIVCSTPIDAPAEVEPLLVHVEDDRSSPR